MKSKFLLVLLPFFLFSCKKDIETSRENISGEWNWKTSYGKGDGGISYSAVPNGNMPILVSFNPNGSFVNKSACLLPVPTQGTYEVKTLNYSSSKTKVLILKSSNLKDTFNLSVNGQQMTLSERHPRVYMHVHEFTKL